MVALLSPSELENLIEQTVQTTVAALDLKPTPSVMTKKQLAAYVRKPVSTINRWMKEGLPFKKEGKEYPEFYRKHVDAWLEERFSECIQDISRQKDHGEG